MMQASDQLERLRQRFAQHPHHPLGHVAIVGDPGVPVPHHRWIQARQQRLARVGLLGAEHALCDDQRGRVRDALGDARGHHRLHARIVDRVPVGQARQQTVGATARSRREHAEEVLDLRYARLLDVERRRHVADRPQAALGSRAADPGDVRAGQPLVQLDHLCAAIDRRLHDRGWIDRVCEQDRARPLARRACDERTARDHARSRAGRRRRAVCGRPPPCSRRRRPLPGLWSRRASG